MMKKGLIPFILVMMFIISCGGSEDEVVKPDPTPVDNVVAVNDSYQTDEDTAVQLTGFLSNDTYTNGKVNITFESTSQNNGSITNNNSNYTYTPASGYFGTDSFKYTICSTITPTSCSTATITVVVNEVTSGGGNSGNFTIPSELLSYYSSVDLSKTGLSLKDAIATKTINAHTTILSYGWDVLKKSDLDPTDNSKVLLIYGYNDNDGNYVTDRSRGVNDNGGTQGSDWNREHVYPKSLGNPNLGTSGPGADTHHLRPSDVKMNSNRGSKKFATGSGNAGDANGGWYPGDEWKGDVARMMLYMYIRYGNQCLPKNVAIGSTNSSDANMINLLLEWNVEDPISDFEINRNNIVANEQGNRNPFIDNPYLATVIWGGEAAQNTWE